MDSKYRDHEIDAKGRSIREGRVGLIVAGSLITGFVVARPRDRPVRRSSGTRDHGHRPTRMGSRLGVIGGAIDTLEPSTAAVGNRAGGAHGSRRRMPPDFQA